MKTTNYIILILFAIWTACTSSDSGPIVKLEVDNAILTFNLQDTKAEMEKRKRNYEDTTDVVFVGEFDDSYFQGIMNYLDTCKNDINLKLGTIYGDTEQDNLRNSLLFEIQWTSFELLRQGKGQVYDKNSKKAFTNYTYEDFKDMGGQGAEFKLPTGETFWKVYTVLY